ncbi:hypothetical protein X801_03586, partial [Opisthorchis viverrini]
MFFTKSSIRPSIYIGIVNMFFNSSQRRRGHSPKTFFTIKRDYFNTFVQQIRETLSTSHKMVRELCDRVDVEHRLDTPDFACPQWLCKAGCRDVFTSLFQVAANPLISSSLDLSELKLLTPVFISSDSTK